jgi:hypothetical protein
MNFDEDRNCRVNIYTYLIWHYSFKICYTFVSDYLPEMVFSHSVRWYFHGIFLMSFFQSCEMVFSHSVRWDFPIVSHGRIYNSFAGGIIVQRKLPFDSMGKYHLKLLQDNTLSQYRKISSDTGRCTLIIESIFGTRLISFTYFSDVTLLFEQWIIFKNLQFILLFLNIWTLTFYCLWSVWFVITCGRFVSCFCIARIHFKSSHTRQFWT